MKTAKAILVVLGLVAMAAPSQAGTIYYFDQITNNGGPGDNVESQLRVDVIDAGPGQVAFTFYNDVGIESSISEIYFDDGSLLGIASITDSDGAGDAVVYTQGASPGDLPGGESLADPFNVTATFLVDSVGNPSRGVNVLGEYVTITFNLINGKTYADVLNALNNQPALDEGAADDGLRIGLHVRDINGVQSNSYINKPPDEVPDGGTTLSLLGGALLGLGMLRRRFTR